MEGSDFLILSTIIGNLLGWFLKNKTGFRNELIPAAQLFLAVIRNMLVGAGVVDPGASVLSHLTPMVTDAMLAGSGFVLTIGSFTLSCFADASLTVGVHSMVKNTAQIRKERAPKKVKKNPRN